MNIFSKLFKTKKPHKVVITKTFCDKHGLVPNFTIACEGKQYPCCGHCFGEIVSQHCKIETTELVQE